jgi:Holliday junction resolvase RusA-like endonuclease
MIDCNPLLQQKREHDKLCRLFYATMTPNELKRRFPNASDSFIKRNLSPVRGLQNTEPQRSAKVALGVEGEAKQAGPSRRQVSITSVRKRLIDPDNLFVKPLIDALRYEGVIADDSAAHIVLVVKQEKVNHKHDERTVIEISDIE